MLKSVNLSVSRSLDLVVIGRLCFAIALLGFGVLHFIFAEFVSGRAPAWPATVPGKDVWVYVSGFIMAGAGVAIIIRKTHFFLITAAVIIFAWALLRHIPILVADLKWGGELTSAGKALTLWGGLLIAGSLSAEVGGTWSSKILKKSDFFIALGRISLAIFLIICGIEHFIFVDFVQQLVPTWIPGDIFWTYFTGGALVAGGLGLLFRKTLTTAAFLTGAMIFVWFLILHIPRAMAAQAQNSANEWTAVCESLAFSGIAFVLAGISSAKTGE